MQKVTCSRIYDSSAGVPHGFEPMLAESNRADARGVKKVERTLWPMNSEVASSTESQFWVDIEANLIGGGEETSQNDRAAQLKPNRLVRDRCGDRKRMPTELSRASIRPKQARVVKILSRRSNAVKNEVS